MESTQSNPRYFISDTKLKSELKSIGTFSSFLFLTISWDWSWVKVNITFIILFISTESLKPTAIGMPLDHWQIMGHVTIKLWRPRAICFSKTFDVVFVSFKLVRKTLIRCCSKEDVLLPLLWNSTILLSEYLEYDLFQPQKDSDSSFH